MVYLKQSTAVTLLIGPFIDDTDGKTAETGLTIAQADVRLSKNGGNMAQKNEATSCTHDELGYYTCPLDATDTGTLGILKVMVHESGALPVWEECMVVTANVWDTLCSTEHFDVNAVEISGDSTAADNLESACDNYSVTRGLAGTALPNAAADAAGGLPISDAGGLDLDTQIGTDIDAILADTNELQTNQGNWATATGFSTHSAADVVNEWETQSQADPTGFHVNVMEVGGTAQTANDNGADINAILADTNELQTNQGNWATATGFSTHSAADVADAVWDEASTGHTDAGKAGAQMWTDVDAILADTNELQTDDIPGTLTTIESKIDTVDTNVDAILVDTGTTLQAELDGIQADTEDLQTQIGVAGAGLTAVPWNATWDAEVQSECTDALNAYDPPTDAEMDTAFAALNDITVADIIGTALAQATYAPQEAPPVNATVGEILAYLFKAWRNKSTTDADSYDLYADDGTTVDQTATLSDDGTTFTRGEVGSGA